jgi:hypothetical protein
VYSKRIPCWKVKIVGNKCKKTNLACLDEDVDHRQQVEESEAEQPTSSAKAQPVVPVPDLVGIELDL